MTNEHIEKARQIRKHIESAPVPVEVDMIPRTEAEAMVKAAIEECAKVADAYAKKCGGSTPSRIRASSGKIIATDIRAIGEAS